MKKIFIVSTIILVSLSGCAQNMGKNEENLNNTNMVHLKKLTKDEERVIIHKGTEAPFSGKYEMFFEDGIYTCKQCGAELFKSENKFDARCGWPSFDEAIPGAVKQSLDADGRRTEIICARCEAHLGHVFTGEGFTKKNTRHCVNSISLEFTPLNMIHKVENDTAIFAGGCFWGVEYYLQQEPGVISTQVGYIGGHTMHPDYKEVCSHKTGHAEAVEVIFDPLKTSFEKLAKLFFEIYDPTQVNRQGPDVGDQYRSEIFYLNTEQKEIVMKLIKQLEDKGYKIATVVSPATEFWKAEDYHQDYYENNGKKPYCHVYTKRF